MSLSPFSPKSGVASRQRPPHAPVAARGRRAFTLVEILIVLAIIAILAALLFPAFARARESGRETSCVSNMHQISIAVQLYWQDEKRYPEVLRDLLPNDVTLDGGPNKGGAGYYKGGLASLVCPNDDTEFNGARSSYGDISFAPSPAPPFVDPTAALGQRTGYDATAHAPVANVDAGRYVWNYWGYATDGEAYLNPDEADGTAHPTTGAPSTALMNPSNPYNSRYLSSYPPDVYTSAVPENLVKCSLSNRNAPPQTIITHCLYHRLNTGNNLDYPGQLYDGAHGANARDIVLRVDGSAKSIDVSTFQPSGGNPWQQPKF